VAGAEREQPGQLSCLIAATWADVQVESVLDGFGLRDTDEQQGWALPWAAADLD
jgi:hypothetical protein